MGAPITYPACWDEDRGGECAVDSDVGAAATIPGCVYGAFDGTEFIFELLDGNGA